MKDYTDDGENPSMKYDLNVREGIVVDLRWARRSDHKEEGNENSYQDYKLVLTLTPMPTSNDTTNRWYEREVIRKEVKFKVNYRSNFSYDEHEPDYVAQLAMVKQPPVITQSFERCNYTEIQFTAAGFEPFALLKETVSGALIDRTQRTKDNKTAVYEFVAGNEDNVLDIEVSVLSDVQECPNEGSDNHQGNVIDTSAIIPYDYKQEYSDTIWGRVKKVINDTNIFPNVQPFEEVENDGEGK